MKRTVLHFAALCGLALLLAGSASAQNRQPNQTPLRAARADSPIATDKTSDAGKTSDTNKTSDAAAPAAEVEGLKHRVEELENRNRALAQSLADINAKLNAIARTESNASTTNAATSIDAATPANAVAQSPGREIRGRGGWGEANVKLSRYLTISPGFTTDDPVDRDLGTGARTRNQAFYLGDRISPSANFFIGADYLRWRTDYKGFSRGTDNRVNIFLQYSF